MYKLLRYLRKIPFLRLIVNYESEISKYYFREILCEACVQEK